MLTMVRSVERKKSRDIYKTVATLAWPFATFATKYVITVVAFIMLSELTIS